MTLTIVRKDELEDRIHRIADSLRGEVQEGFLEAADQLKRSLGMGELTDLIEDGKLDDAMRFISGLALTPAQLAPLKNAIEQIAVSSAAAVAAEFGMSFDAVNDRAVAFATAQTSLTFSQVAQTSFEAIREVLADGQRGLVGGPRDQARQIRDLLGLDERSAAAVNRVYRGAIESGLNRVDARRLAERTARRSLQRRAENIARTETILAANEGTVQGWLEARDKGFLPPQAVKVWIATEDSRTCPICAVLDGNQVDVGGSFVTDVQASSFDIDGEKITVRGTVPLKRSITTRTPPAHPRCRCTVGIELAEVDEEVVVDPQQDLHDLNDKRLAKYEEGGEKGPRPGIDDNPEIVEAARKKYEEAVAREQGMSAVLGEIKESTGAEFALWEERIKYEASIREKISREIREAAEEVPPRILTVQQAVDKIRDHNRYTFTWDPDGDYAKKMLAAESALNEAGWETVKNDNFWVKGGSYDGQNYVFKRGDELMELQFHTPKSMEIKMVSHELYDDLKGMTRGTSEWTELNREIEALWNVDRSHVPPGMDDIGNPRIMSDRWTVEQVRALERMDVFDWDAYLELDVNGVPQLGPTERRLLRKRVEETRALFPDDETFVDAVKSWTDAPFEQKIAMDTVFNPDTYDPTALKQARIVELLEAIEDNTPFTKPDTLYRGIVPRGEHDGINFNSASIDEAYDWLDTKYAPGTTHDWHIQAFSEQSIVSEAFASSGTLTSPQVLFEWIDDGKALPIYNLSSVAPEAEWLGAGRFEVVSTRFDTIRNTYDMGFRSVSDEAFVVTIRQVEGLLPPSPPAT